MYNTHFAKNEYQMYNTHDTSTTHPRKPHNTPKETESRKAMLKKMNNNATSKKPRIKGPRFQLHTIELPPLLSTRPKMHSE